MDLMEASHDTVDGINPANQFDMAHIPSFQAFSHPRWCRISSINSISFYHRTSTPLWEDDPKRKSSPKKWCPENQSPWFSVPESNSRALRAKKNQQIHNDHTMMVGSELLRTELGSTLPSTYRTYRFFQHIPYDNPYNNMSSRISWRSMIIWWLFKGPVLLSLSWLSKLIYKCLSCVSFATVCVLWKELKTRGPFGMEVSEAMVTLESLKQKKITTGDG